MSAKLGAWDKRRRRAQRFRLCQRCLKPCGVNPHTGKAYTYCAACRPAVAAAQRSVVAALRQRWLAFNLCRDCGAEPHQDATGRRYTRCWTHLLAQAAYQKKSRARRCASPALLAGPAGSRTRKGEAHAQRQ